MKYRIAIKCLGISDMHGETVYLDYDNREHAVQELVIMSAKGWITMRQAIELAFSIGCDFRDKAELLNPPGR